VVKADFELTRAALIERLGARTVIYGRWDALFGCWTREGDGRANRFTPHWPLLDDFGEPATYDEGSAALLADYAALIPRDVRRVAGPFGSSQWVVLMMINCDQALEGFLRVELRTSGPGFVAACMALAGAGAMDREELRTLCHRIMHEKREQLIRSYMPPLPVGWLRKLDVEAATLQTCILLTGIASDPDKSRVANHAPLLTLGTVMWLDQLPPWACSFALIQVLCECTEAGRSELCDELVALCELIMKDFPDMQRDAARSLRGVRGADQLAARIDALQLRLASLVSFPAPPIHGLGGLEPLASAEAMRSEGRRMRNCIGKLLWQVLDGDLYFFRWTGNEAATVCLVHEPSGDWAFGECLGSENEPLSTQTAAEIVASLAPALERHANSSSADLAQLPDGGLRVEAERLGKGQKLDHVNATLSALDQGNERLKAPKLLRQFGLGQASLLPALDQEPP
jgi:hypothetical protein